MAISTLIGQLAPINNPGLLDRALAMVALALAAGGHAEAAIEAARTVEDRAVRTRALIELAQPQPQRQRTPQHSRRRAGRPDWRRARPAGGRAGGGPGHGRAARDRAAHGRAAGRG
ncbi:MAG: hypothetical protein U0Z44_09690 [Kouleothrix sp.]